MNVNMQYQPAEYFFFLTFYAPLKKKKNYTGFMAAITIFKKCNFK